MRPTAALRFVLFAALTCVGLLSCEREQADIESFKPKLCTTLVNLRTLLSGPGGRLGSPKNAEIVEGIRTVEAELLVLSDEMSEAGLDEEAGRVQQVASALTELTRDMEGPDRPESYQRIADSGVELLRVLSPILRTFGGCVQPEDSSVGT